MYDCNLSQADLAGGTITDANLTNLTWSNSTCTDGVPQPTECAY
jgi:hypothetical protein